MHPTANEDLATVLVTGATGFIGERLVRRLSRAGHTVRAFGRRSFAAPPGVAHEAGMPGAIRVFAGDVTDAATLKPAMDGCQAVYHLAGHARNWAPDPAIYQRVNVDGLANVLECARACGVKRLVWTSTMMTLGPSPRGVLIDESTSPVQGPFTHYDRSKVAAEALAARYAVGGLSVVTVNPTRVFGPGHLSEGNALSLLVDQYDRGRAPILFNRGRNVANYVFVDDVVEGLLLAMQRGRSGERYLLGGENLSLREFLDLVDKVSGVRHFRIPVRRAGAMAFAYLQLARARLFGAYPRITPPWVRVFLADWVCSCEKARRELGYCPRPVEECLRITYQWLVRMRAEHAR
jgi:nucleoside-diphosphate-sugar epimerase